MTTDYPATASQSSDETETLFAAGRWSGDTGTLSLDSRRALLRLVQGPYLSAARSPGPWAALLADEASIASRLHDLFLELVVDREAGFAFARNAQTGEVDAPVAVRSEQLTFLDTAMLIVLRQALLTNEHERRVIVGRDEIFEQLTPFRTADRDESDFAKRLNSSWAKMKNRLRVIHTAADDRVEISPVLRILVDVDQVRSISAEYERIAAGDPAVTKDMPTASDTGMAQPDEDEDDYDAL